MSLIPKLSSVDAFDSKITSSIFKKQWHEVKLARMSNNDNENINASVKCITHHDVNMLMAIVLENFLSLSAQYVSRRCLFIHRKSFQQNYLI